MTRIYLETGRKKTIACALDWPGWARIGADGDRAVAALDGHADRYRTVATAAGLVFDPGAFEVVETVTGTATTDWGAPAVPIGEDTEPYTAERAARTGAVLRAAWEALDDLAVSAPEELARGPRGGGRDRDAVVAHVIRCEREYARKIGVRHRPFEIQDRDAVAALRSAVLDVLAQPGPADAPAGGAAWPAAYAARRFAWHVLDHVWEIEDKS